MILALASAPAALAQTGMIAPTHDVAAEPARSTGGADAVQPGDIVRIQVWREPELSGEFAVDEAGVVVLPRVGRMDVGHHTAASLEEELVATFSEFLRHSSIDVTVLRRIQILGAVHKPGLYPVDATMTVSDAIALAGGATTQGQPDRVELVRGGRRVATRLSGETQIGDSQIQSGDQLFVPERSWISRNATVVAATITSGVSLLITLLR